MRPIGPFVEIQAAVINGHAARTRFVGGSADEKTHAAMSGPESAATKAERRIVHSGEPIPLNDFRGQWQEIAASVQREFDDVSVVLWNVRRKVDRVIRSMREFSFSV
jgi:hypothetical protein